LFGADRHENVSLLQPAERFSSLLWPAPVPTAWNAEQTRADQNWFGTFAAIEEAALPLT
jgi:hypothetical protein